MPRTLPRPIVNPDPQVTDMKALGRLVRDRRGQIAMRIDDAAALMGVSKSMLSRLENGQSVSLDKVFKVLEGLGLTLLLFDHQAAGFVLRQRRMRIEQREREQAGARAGEQET